jgi:hypothetical protein
MNGLEALSQRYYSSLFFYVRHADSYRYIKGILEESGAPLPAELWL